MKTKKYLLMSGSFILLITSLIFVIAQTQNIQFPITELGGCASETECKTYCDEQNNMEACLDYAEANNLMDSEEIKEARSVLPFLISGTTPGKCKEKEECDAYCEKEENLVECVDFALNNGLMSKEEAEMVKKTGGKGPGGCRMDECDTYCDLEENFDVCVDFAVDNGLMSAEEAEMAKKVGSNGGPGGCRGEEECDAYCEDNMRECMDWMLEYDIMSKEDKQRLENMGDDEKCMMNCMIDDNLRPGSDCGPGTPGGPGCNKCAGQCFDFSAREGMDEEHACMAKCMVESGLAPGKDCTVEGESAECTSCGKQCFKNAETPGINGKSLPNDQKCMAECMVDAGLTPGVDSSGPGYDSCLDNCFEKPQEQRQESGEDNNLPNDQKCMAECMIDAGLTPGVDSSGPGYDSCIDDCFEKPQAKEQEPSSEEPTSEEPTSEEPASEEPASEEPAPEEPAPEEPAPEEPAPEEPAPEEEEEEKEEPAPVDSESEGITGEVVKIDSGNSFNLIELIKKWLGL